MQILYSRDITKFQSCFEPHCKSEAKCKAFHVTISFVCIEIETNFHSKDFARSLVFITRLRNGLLHCASMIFFFCASAHIYHITVCFDSQHPEGVMTGRFLLKEHVAPMFLQVNIFYSIEF